MCWLTSSTPPYYFLLQLPSLYYLVLVTHMRHPGLAGVADDTNKTAAVAENVDSIMSAHVPARHKAIYPTAPDEAQVHADPG